MRGRCADDAPQIEGAPGTQKNRSDRRRQRSDRYHEGIFPEGEESDGDEGGGTSAADMIPFYRIGKKSHVSKSFQRPQYFERIRSGRDACEETVRLRRGEAAETLYNYLVLLYIYIFARVFLPLAADQEEGKAAGYLRFVAENGGDTYYAARARAQLAAMDTDHRNKEPAVRDV